MVSRHYNGFQALQWFPGSILVSRHYIGSLGIIMVSRHYNGFQALQWFPGIIMVSRHYNGFKAL